MAGFAGARVSPFFDSMLVKVTSWVRTLSGAIERGHRALREFRVRGVKTNIGFLQNVLRHPTFVFGEATVDFIDTHPELFEITQRFDRATKTLRYIANLTVNGNRDIDAIDQSKTFRKAAVPQFDRLSEYPSGSKNQLDEMGPESFCRMIRQ